MDTIFNNKIHKLRRERAFKNWNNFSYLKKISTERIYERLYEVKRDFDLGLDLGSHYGELGHLLSRKNKINTLFQTDFIYNYCKKSKNNYFNSLLIDFNKLPFKKNKFNIIVSTFFIHWIEDVPNLLKNLKNIMQPDSLLIMNFLGGKTLSELQKQLIDLEIKFYGGASPRIMPFIDIRSAGMLIQNAGFRMPVIDSENINITHSNLFDLFHDLRGMGQTNCMSSVSIPLRKKITTLLEKKLTNKNKINTTFELITVTACNY